jgi:hypothetical protein
VKTGRKMLKVRIEYKSGKIEVEWMTLEHFSKAAMMLASEGRLVSMTIIKGVKETEKTATAA